MMTYSAVGDVMGPFDAKIETLERTQCQGDHSEYPVYRLLVPRGSRGCRGVGR